ncbi:MAG: hypothetical protein CEO12_362 [Parcubacteria group bacterium Gr01-1014_46]|nr:MAG: hypothetical protein CEO12_362 [Parcubacteria group bacterium Gr01-1014_46]
MHSLTEENRNYQNLLDQAEGAYLKKEYLEAFLIQSCIIEGVIKNYASKKFSYLVEGNSLLKNKFENWDVSRLVDDLLLSGKIDNYLYKNLNAYRKKRNSVIHDLLSHEDKNLLDEELKKTYELGREMKGFIVDDMSKNDNDASIAELQGQINDLLSTIVSLQSNLISSSGKGNTETEVIMLQIGKLLQQLELTRHNDK